MKVSLSIVFAMVFQVAFLKIAAQRIAEAQKLLKVCVSCVHAT